MSEKKSISDYTEAEFLAFVKQIFNVENTTESEDIKNILLFKKLTEHPDGSDLIYYPREDRPDSPEGVVKEVKEWRAKNGKPGFKKG
ncbi:bacteriocin immunity protein [Providencia hangzhouensis]